MPSPELDQTIGRWVSTIPLTWGKRMKVPFTSGVASSFLVAHRIPWQPFQCCGSVGSLGLSCESFEAGDIQKN